ncbi:hypothetical protein ACSSS7_001013 [Eimeria intestinalis]
MASMPSVRHLQRVSRGLGFCAGSLQLPQIDRRRVSPTLVLLLLLLPLHSLYAYCLVLPPSKGSAPYGREWAPPCMQRTNCQPACAGQGGRRGHPAKSRGVIQLQIEVSVHCSFSLVAPAEPSAPAREHIKKALAKCRAILQDGRIFVTQQGEDFPRNFRSFVSHILVQLLQMYCHIYRQHFDWLLEPLFAYSHQRCPAATSSNSSSSSSVDTDTVAHVNCCFKHALYFGSEFRLVKLEDGLALHFLEQAQRDIAEAEASEKQHQAGTNHRQQQQQQRQQQQQPQLQQPQPQQDKR